MKGILQQRCKNKFEGKKESTRGKGYGVRTDWTTRGVLLALGGELISGSEASLNVNQGDASTSALLWWGEKGRDEPASRSKAQKKKKKDIGIISNKVK